MPVKRKIAIVGASGYSGEELVGLLLRHPGAEIACLTSRSEAGRALDSVFPRFRGLPQADTIRFVNSGTAEIAASGAEFAFLALPHGLAAEFAVPLLQAGLRVIDLSADFRLRDASVYAEFYGHAHPAPDLLPTAAYGLPEFRRDEIRRAALVAAPGCYPTSILVPLVPLLRRRLLKPASITITALSGVSGAGRKADISLLFAECNESARVYGAPKHRHLSEIEQELSDAAGETVRVTFTPHLIPVTRGMLATIYAAPEEGIQPEAIETAWREQFAPEPFVRRVEGDRFPTMADVARTNFIDLAWRHDARTGRVILFSAQDNLMKGASGQAVQCFNAMIGAAETTGLL